MTPYPLPSLAAAAWLQAPHLQQLMATLNANGARTRFVGGCVRNALMGLPVTDIDLATTLPPEAVIAGLSTAGFRTIPTGLEHGTVTALCDGQSIEITTLRVDVRTDGRRAAVAFTDNWQADAARRDFTINALYADRDGTVFDPLGGYADLVAGRVRFIGDPDARIREDALRILRFFRFVACLQPDTEPLDASALAACGTRAALTEILSGERIQKEMLRLLAAPHPLRALAAMEACGVLTRIGFPAGALAHSAALLSRLLLLENDPAPLRRLYVLADGDSARLARLARRWRLARRDGDHLAHLATVLLDAHSLDDTTARWLLLDAVPFAVFADAVLVHWARTDRTCSAARAALQTLLATAAASKARPFPVSGRDLMAHGIAPGPMMGERLAAGRRLWARSGFTLKRIDILEKIIDK